MRRFVHSLSRLIFNYTHSTHQDKGEDVMAAIKIVHGQISSDKKRKLFNGEPFLAYLEGFVMAVELHRLKCVPRLPSLLTFMAL